MTSMNKLQGKTVSFLGDSITCGFRLENPEEDQYPKKIEEIYGIKERNFGITGTLKSGLSA